MRNHVATYKLSKSNKLINSISICDIVISNQLAGRLLWDIIIKDRDRYKKY